MFIFLLLTLFLAVLTQESTEIQVDEMLLANDNVSAELLIANQLDKWYYKDIGLAIKTLRFTYFASVIIC